MERMDQDQVAAQLRKQAAGERSVRCAVCATETSGLLSACTVCGTAYHSDCWTYNGGCAVYGCKAAPRAAEPLQIAVVGAAYARWRPAILTLGALACLMLGVVLGERNAAARILEEGMEAELDAGTEADFADLACTVEVFEGPREIETLRTVHARFRRAADLVAAARRKLLLSGQLPVAFEVDPAGDLIELRGPERLVATVHRSIREMDVP